MHNSYSISSPFGILEIETLVVLGDKADALHSGFNGQVAEEASIKFLRFESFYLLFILLDRDLVLSLLEAMTTIE